MRTDKVKRSIPKPELRNEDERSIPKPELEDKKAKRSALNRQLYNAARALCPAGTQNHPEAVRIVRDEATNQIYGKNYDLLTDRQIEFVIKKLRMEHDRKKLYATPNQLKLLSMNMLMCALIYCKFDDVQFVDDSTGEVYVGEQIRELARMLFDANRRMPAQIIKYMHEKWINPKANEFMEQGNFKKFTKNKEVFYKEYLSAEAAKYLINRFQQIYQRASHKFQPLMPEMN